MKKISVVVPCFNEAETLNIFYQELLKHLKEVPLVPEIFFIDDGSSDKTLFEIKKIQEKDPQVRFISFSRNFGKEAAIFAGLKNASGDYIVVMDADLQDPPSLLPQMVDAVVKEGYDSVATCRKNREGEPKIRSFFAHFFYIFINKISSVKIVPGSRDYRLMTRQMVNAILELSEYNRFTKGIYPWVGFKTKWISFQNIQREKGASKWSLLKLFCYSVEGITAFSTFPLNVASFLGFFFCFFSFLGILLVIFQKIFFDQSADGWTSLVCILFFISGIQLFCIGILGQYLSKTYLETKKRPLFIIKERN